MRSIRYSDYSGTSREPHGLNKNFGVTSAYSRNLACNTRSVGFKMRAVVKSGTVYSKNWLSKIIEIRASLIIIK